MNEILTEEKLELARRAREAMREDFYNSYADKLGEETINAFRDFCSLYDEGLYIWLAGLWQPEIGGFYYSEGGRDMETMLPDLESTKQAISFIQISGLAMDFGRGKFEAVSPEMQEKIIGFVKSLQDEESGYFYHPQWKKRISTSRRGRDLGWAVHLIKEFGGSLDYKTPLERSSSGKASAALPDHLKSTEAFKNYLNERDFLHNSYPVGNLLQAQCSQIIAAGEEYVDILINHINERQNPDTGLWGEKINYDSVNGLMKLVLIYAQCKRPVPNALAALGSCVKAAMSSEEITFVCQFYNPIVTMANLIDIVAARNGADAGADLRKKMKELAPDMIRVTKEKVMLCRKKNGSFSYNPNHSCFVSQGAPITDKDLNEGDVNASCISSTGMTGHFTRIFGIPDMPLFCAEDAKIFHELLKNSKVYSKTKARPLWMDEWMAKSPELK